MRHELKTWPEQFRAVAQGWKRHETRVNDRDFNRGDTLILREYDPDREKYTGKSLEAQVVWINKGDFGLPTDLCVMTIRLGYDAFSQVPHAY